MKSLRQSKILELIRTECIDTQSELLEKLQESGFRVTQATVSRDIKEMRLIKTQSADGRYRYACEPTAENDQESHAYLLANAVIDVDHTQHLVVIKTKSGMAQAVCAALDATQRSGVLGSIAGDDTIFVATRTEAVAVGLVSDLRRQAEGGSAPAQ